MIKMIGILDLNNSRKLMFFLLLIFSSCGGGEEKKDKMIDVFNEPNAMVQNEVEEKIPPSEKTLSHEEVLGDAETEKKVEKVNVSAGATKVLELGDIYSLVHKFNFTPIDLYRVSDTDLLAVGAFDVRTLSLGDNKEVELLSRDIYKQLFNKEMPLITASYQAGNNFLILGFINGEVLEYNGEKWRALEGGPAYSGDRVNAILEHEGRILVASRGIYIWDSQLNKFMSSQESKAYNINSLVPISPNLVLLVNSDSIVSLSFPEKAFNIFYEPLANERPILSVKEEGDNLLVGTLRGVIRISKAGNFISRFSSNFSVSKIERNEKNEYFVITDKGPGVISNDEIVVDSTLGNGKVTAILGGGTDEAILGFISGELAKVGFEDIVNQKSKLNKAQRISEIFPNACHAYTKLLNSSSYSHQLSALSIDRRDYVFIDGKQVCPNGVGIMDMAETALVYSDNVLLLSDKGAVATIKLTEGLENLKITSLLLSKDRKIYVGTEKGLFISGEKSWDRVADSKELMEDYISDIVQDQRGNIWVATRLSDGKLLEVSTDYHALHAKVGDIWAHFGGANGVRALGLSDLSFSDGDLLMGSAWGFSVLSPRSELITYGRASGIEKTTVESIVRDRRGRTWMSSGFFFNGISWIDQDKIYTVEEPSDKTSSAGLFSNRISRIGVDELDRVWIVDSAGKTGVYDYQTLKEMAVEKSFLASRSSRDRFLP